MKPQITKGDMSQIPTRQKKKLCSCHPPCKEVYWFTTDHDEFGLCRNDAKAFLKETLTLMEWYPNRYGWNEAAEQMIIDHVKEYGFSNYKIIADKLDKDADVIKRKIYRMRDAGRLGGIIK